MKKKTSISVSSSLLKLVDSLPNKPPRSQVIEQALIYFFKSKQAQARDKTDFDILNKKSDELNEEALDTLKYQTD